MSRGTRVIEALCAAGVAHIVLAPGSRSAPLALAAAAAEHRGEVNLHVRLDERSAGYLALGLAKASRAPVAVITTSGTAAVNLHPAIVEASYGGVPVIAITADRPQRLRGVGANQTIAQADLFAGEVRFSVDAVVPDCAADALAVRAAITAATDPVHPGPAHLNIALDEPLVSTDLGGTSTQRQDPPLPRALEESKRAVVEGDPESARGLIIVGDTSGFPAAIADPQAIGALATATGWPVISEPSGNASNLVASLSHGPLILTEAAFCDAHVPDIVVTIGRVGLHRSVMRFVNRATRHLAVDPRPAGYACDPLRTAERIVPTLPNFVVEPDPAWAQAWRDADQQWIRRITDAFPTAPADPMKPEGLDGAQVARVVVESLTEGDCFVVGPSWPVRHVSAYSGRVPARVYANRGTSGIDGVVSTAWGVAAATGGFTVALLGDLTALYDRNGLLCAPGEAPPHLAYVVVDNNGGGIFGELEQADPAFGSYFERVFATPHSERLADLLCARSVSVREVVDVSGLTQALEQAREGPGVQIIVVTTVERGEQIRRFATLTD